MRPLLHGPRPVVTVYRWLIDPAMIATRERLVANEAQRYALDYTGRVADPAEVNTDLAEPWTASADLY